MPNDLMTPAAVEWTMGGRGDGGIASMLLRNNGDVGALRPYYLDEDVDAFGNLRSDAVPYQVVSNRRTGELEAIVSNNPATLRFQDWRLIDEAVIRVAKPRLRLIGDLRGANLDVSLANGMAFTVFSYERQSDMSAATISMSGTRQGESDRPAYDIQNTPLPIIHKDFSFETRQILASRNGYSPLDTTGAELAARRVAEGAEQLAMGVWPSYAFGGGTVYGLSNFPQRITYSMTKPTAGGWTPATTVSEVLAMRLASQLAFHYGPWMLYCSPNWDQYLDADYSSAKGTDTLRERLRRIEGVLDVKTLDYLQFLTGNPYTMLLVQFTSDVIREIIGLDITTLQWESHGGMEMNFKVMGIMVPQPRADQNNNCGIVHGSVAS